ncbi:hypothetical protein CO661_24340 [Sinorhizobium fredii]|uniref:Uncharacterized protein n=1 Tax=Rhizobium fredii TaxID=380 RepID=A0A2A6LT46_RHIFR|nr:hypothetical protein [Sinorhizobium fredii]MQX12246.1 hypothetical protein [Sinorhizobium fredii]PDT45392.1 hypothetical protein CO661_24340 [Sinorhizobium fredii]UTY49261.1 hypothetical protein EPK84_22080 [Sinorhizobium fredii]
MDIPQPPPGIKFLSLSKTRISLLGHRETSLKLPILQINFNCRLRNPTSTFLFASIPDLSFDGRLRESARQRREFRRTARLPARFSAAWRFQTDRPSIPFWFVLRNEIIRRNAAILQRGFCPPCSTP